MKLLLLLLPLLFAGCGSLVEGFAPDYEVEEGQPAKPVVTPEVEPGVGPINADGKISEGPWEPVQSPASEPERVLEAGRVRSAFQNRPRLVRRVFSRCGPFGCR